MYATKVAIEFNLMYTKNLFEKYLLFISKSFIIKL